jgi:UDP-N-acetylglucosamine transferase subunit ALG13
MIFVVLGTWEMPFRRPLAELERAAVSGVLNDSIIVQSGNTRYESRHMTLVPFFDKEALEAMYDRASLVISQAGVGSIMMGLRRQKKVIAIARRRRYNEHIDDHQLEILDVFSKTGAILPWRGEGDLDSVLAQIPQFAPTPYPFAEERISDAILEYLSERIPAVS